MPTELTQAQIEKLIPLAPKHTFLIVDTDGEVVTDALDEAHAKDICVEGEFPLKYVREDLVTSLFYEMAGRLPEELRNEMRKRVDAMLKSEIEEEEEGGPDVAGAHP